MTTFRVITSCSRKGWDEYGERMVASVAKFWPLGVHFDLYSEDVIPHMMTTSFPEWLFAFKERHIKDHVAQGKVNPRAPYNYRFDAVRFAHKTAAVIDTFDRMQEDVLVWVDADTVTHASVTLEFLEGLVPAGRFGISWLARKDKYPECGFYMLRRNHPQMALLMRAWKGLYTRETIFHMPEWHDSYLLQEMARLTHVPARSISGPEGEKTQHPFINSPLGAVMDHMKGPRKNAGRSLDRDLKVVRTEDYWSKK